VDKLCKTCKKRSTCTSLCPAAEQYVNQDYIRKKEITYTELGIDINNLHNTTITYPNDTILDHIHNAYDNNIITSEDYDLLLQYYHHGYSQQQLADMHNVNQSTISRRLQDLLDLIGSYA